jgi:methionine--tRNA ligase beta chain
MAMAEQATIAFDEFVRVELRVGIVREAVAHPNADRLIRLQIDDGTAEGRQICAGLRGHYEPPESLEGRQVIFVANLEPRTIRGEISQGMVLAAVDGEGDGQRVIAIQPDAPVPGGTRVS